MAFGHASPEAVIAAKIVFTIAAGLLTLARLYTRKRIVNNAGLDDLLIAFGLIASVVLTASTWMQVHYGLGRHLLTLDPEDAADSLLWLWVSIVVYNIALACVKLSVLVQYLRILPSRVKSGPVDEQYPRNKFRIATFAMIAVVLVFSLWAILSAIFTCVPVKRFWHEDVHGSCMERETVWFINAAVNIVADICTVVLPLPVLYSLRISKRQKYILMFVFGIAGITVVMSILRLPFLYISIVSKDVIWDSSMISITSNIELDVAIIASCIPTLRGMFTRLFPSLTNSEKYFGRTGISRSRDSLDGDALKHLERFGEPGRISSRSSVDTTTHLNSTSFNATARLDD